MFTRPSRFLFEGVVRHDRIHVFHCLAGLRVGLRETASAAQFRFQPLVALDKIIPHGSASGCPLVYTRSSRFLLEGVIGHDRLHVFH